MKKYNLFLGVLIISLFLVLPFNTYALKNLGRDVQQFTVIRDKMYSAFEAEDHFDKSRTTTYVKWLQKNSDSPFIVYCIDYDTPFDTVSDFEDKGAVDIGIQYIIKNGFTGKEHENQSYHYSTNSNCTADECPSVVNLKTDAPLENQPWYVNYWITQIAIWQYQGKMSVTSGSDLTDNQKAIKKLVNGAKAVKESTVNFVNVDPKMSVSNNNLTIDGDYYYSKIISASDVGETFSVSVNNENYEVVDANKKAKTTFNSGDKFYIRVLKSKVSKTENVTVTLSTKGATYANKYTSDDGAQSVATYVVTKKSAKTATLKLIVNYSCDLTVKIVDNLTNEKVCGGTFTVYDEAGNIAKDKSGKEVGNIELSKDKCEETISLSDGKYRVVQQTSVNPYLKDSQEYEVVTGANCPLDVTLKDEKLYQIRILKISGSDDNAISGAKLKFEDSEGNVIKEFVSSTEPQLIENLHAGTYYLSEIEAPAGYSLSSEKVTIEVNNDNNNKQFTFNNDEIIVPSTNFDSTLLGISIILGIVGLSLIYYSKKKLV